MALILQVFIAPPVLAEPKLQGLKPCAQSTELPCLDSISATDLNGKVIEGILLPERRQFPFSFAGQSTGNIDTFEWRIPGTKHENGNDKLSISVMYFPYGAKYCWLENQCMTGVDELILHAVGAWWDTPQPTLQLPDKPSNKICGTRDNPSVCGINWGLDKNYKYSFNIKVGDQFSFSHANGQAFDGSVSEWLNKNNEKVLTFTGKPADVSVVYTTDLNPNTIRTQQKADVTLVELSAYIQSTRSDQSKWLANCNYGKGMSLWYSGQLVSLPSWYPEDQSVGINLESPHLRADGSDNYGAFNIVVPLDTAKCLWGVDLSKTVTASVSANYGNSGVPEIVTTTTNVSNGNFNIKASGFHFSSPNFRVKLKQGNDAPPASGSTAEPKAESVIVKKSTITCTKGKQTKKVTSIKPKCPAGYKKK